MSSLLWSALTLKAPLHDTERAISDASGNEQAEAYREALKICKSIIRKLSE